MPYAPDLSGCALDDRYELHALIGEGAFGRVYRGYDRRLQRTVAVKLIKPWWSDDPQWARSFEREARLLARVSDPGIVQIFDVGEAEEGLYYVSELIDGESLAGRLARGPMPVAEAAAAAEQLCRALERAHSRHVVHRDVKPANLLISGEGQIKVADFGVARLADGSSDGAGATIVGTPRYMAPEQARGRAITPATDVYSAGIVFYEMLVGYPPFEDGPAVEVALRHLRDPPAPLPAHVPDVLAGVVSRALAKDPKLRFASGGAMADALAAARIDPAAGPAPRSGAQAVRRPTARRPDGLQPTRRAPVLHPRRNLNPSARRRSIAALSGAFALLGAMIVAALVLGASGSVTVPRLISLTPAQVRARTRPLALQPSFHHHHSASVPAGRVISQSPRPGGRVDQGSTLRVTISSGPPGVRVPDVGGKAAPEAQSALASVGLRSRLRTIVAPRVPAGVVYGQSPAPGALLSRTRPVILDIAETPHWQPVTGLSGSGQTVTSSFRIRGSRWRVVYRMSYVGSCTFIVFCSGPSAQVDSPASAATVDSFGLNDGARQSRGFATGPGTFRLRVAPGTDTARWSAWVEDWY
ncbi:MAG: eukaryotic-like serine/threonine-protein kinase [Solirubrobacteraceae bacterium]|jgi:serine/threonine-protein kinase|nr:eukaryotic-like serine/threonine-protein kinase [Solirubrobacteraceae bacterium]